MLKSVQKAFDQLRFKNELKKNQREAGKFFANSFKNTLEDKRRYKEFKEYLRQEQEKENWQPGEPFLFKFEHLEWLITDETIIFVTGAKNIGKTVSISNYCKKMIELDPNAEFFLIRNTAEEIERGLRAQLLDDFWPFYLDGATGRLVLKRTEEETKRRTTKPRRIVGYATHLSGLGLKGFQGGSYDNIKAIIWDEANDTGNLDPCDIDKFCIFVNSIRRAKEKMPVFIFQNFLRREDGTVGNVFLDLWGIDPTTRFKRFELGRGKRKQKIMYLNVGELYTPINEYDGGFASSLLGADLSSNLPRPVSPKVLCLRHFLEGDPAFAIVIDYQGQNFILYFAKKLIEDLEGRKRLILIVSCENFTSNRWHEGYSPMTDNRYIYNCFPNLKLIESKTMYQIVEMVMTAFEASIVFFANDNTRIRMTAGNDMFHFWRRRYDIYANQSGLGRKQRISTNKGKAKSFI